MVEGALWREERQRELLAWHAYHIMVASGAKKRSGGALTVADVLGRDYFIPGPHYRMPEPVVFAQPEVATPHDDPLPRRGPVTAVEGTAEAADPIRARLDSLVARGMAVRVQ